jgi:GntR family transcriptional regulator
MQRFGQVVRRTGVTRYHQLYTLLSRALTDGSIPAGSALPSESELMRLYRVGRNTVRRAIGRLEQEQRVVRRRGSRTYALDGGHSQLPWKRLSEMYFDLERLAAATRTHYRRFAWVQTPPKILREVPDFDSRSLLIERARSFQGVNFALTLSYVAERAGSRLTRRALADKLVLTVLKGLGHAPATATLTTTAIGADADSAKVLGIPMGTPLLLTETVSRDPQGRSLLHQQCISRTDLCPLQVQVLYDTSGSGLRWQAADIQPPA